MLITVVLLLEKPLPYSSVRYDDKESKTFAPYFALSEPCCSCSIIYLPSRKLVRTVIAFAICPILLLALSISFFDLSNKF